MGGRAVAPIAAWPGARGVEGDGRAAAAARRSGEANPEGTKLFRRASCANELPETVTAGLADRQRRGGVSLSKPPMSAQAARPILDPLRTAPLGCFGRSSRSWSLG